MGLLLWSSLWLVTVGVSLLFLSYPLSVGGWVIEWGYLNCSPFSITFVLDSLSLVFLLIVIPVSSVVLLYSVEYFKVSKSKNFTFTLCLFIASIVVLSVSGDMVSLIVGWDGLGLSSLCLILFYPSWKGSSGGLTTFVTNRLGDVSLLFVLFIVLVSGGEKSFSAPEVDWVTPYLVIVGGLTNSAQLPFSAWLPLAIAAPTPVSSLVHSSTLVTGGVYVFTRFERLLSDSALFVLTLVSGSTLLLAGSSSLKEVDLNNVVALSTLTHIGLVLFFLSLGFNEVCLFHMLIHAYFNSLLFMSVGEIIHSGFSSQDIRSLSILPISMGTRLSLSVSLVGMIGIPFLSGFYSKELILSLSFENSVLTLGVFSLGALFTIAYSSRILFHSLGSLTSLSTSSSSSSFLLLWSVASIVGGLVGKSLFFSEVVVNSSFLLLFFLFTVGGLTGVVLLCKKIVQHVPLPLLGGGGGMWNVAWLGTVSSLWVWSLSSSLSRRVDVYGLISSLSEHFVSYKTPSISLLFRGISFTSVSTLLLSLSVVCCLVLL